MPEVRLKEHIKSLGSNEGACGCLRIFVWICTCVVDFLRDVDPLPVGQASVHRRSCGRSQRRVEGVDVETQVDRSLFSVGGERI